MRPNGPDGIFFTLSGPPSTVGNPSIEAAGQGDFTVVHRGVDGRLLARLWSSEVTPLASLALRAATRHHMEAGTAAYTPVGPVELADVDVEVDGELWPFRLESDQDSSTYAGYFRQHAVAIWVVNELVPVAKVVATGTRFPV